MSFVVKTTRFLRVNSMFEKHLVPEALCNFFLRHWGERFKLRLNEGIFTTKTMKKHEGLPPWFQELILSWMASAARGATTGLPTSEGTASLCSERAVGTLRQHIRTGNFHPTHRPKDPVTHLFHCQLVIWQKIAHQPQFECVCSSAKYGFSSVG